MNTAPENEKTLGKVTEFLIYKVRRKSVMWGKKIKQGKK